ncbi:hypothetical protein K503DRAFT_866949 [Rhizopogon vinicolor AM-OR11-026]|uniref:Uncharacterized protein n=1 Tax=Rhizopogon vinicolor AM-OR11-026 TaxID=1314800 RepID=A0A1B7MXK9_9AGAM|nr:hypothetical protein K503DRAFT_866949 [Rhizopogon vinicolor AM-OR11-026]
MTGLSTPQRARTKTAELSEIFRSSHSSRNAAKDARTSSMAPVVGVPDTPAEEKHKSRRSMLPFLGRKKSERPSASSSALPKKSTSPPSGSVGTGSNLLTVTSAINKSSSDVPLPSTLPPLNVSPPSLSSKFAAHFTPLRSPSKTLKARYSSSHKSANTIPSTHSSTNLSPLPFDDRGPSLESRGSSTQSRSTTPRPFRQPSAENSPRYEAEEDFSDLFIRPKQTKSAQKASNLSPVIVKAADGSKKSAELGPVIPLTPASPTPPSTPRLQFPIPPSGFGSISLSGEKSFSDGSQESSIQTTTTPSSKHSDSSLKLPTAGPRRSSISRGQQSYRARAFSLSGSDTDASRATDSSVQSMRAKHQSALPKASALKRPASLQRALSSSDKLSSGPPPSVPLPSPPPSASLASGPSIGSLPTIPPVNSVPSHAYSRSTPRPRANTLSSATALSSSKLAAWMAPKTTTQDKNATADTPPLASVDELRNALALQSRKYAQLQEYAVSITKKFEGEKASMTKTIQMLEREVRKKVREIEGLRWLVIHNGGADDIDAAANLARASLVTLDDGDRVDSLRAMDATHGQAWSQSSTTNVSVASVERDAGSVALSLRCRRGLGLDSLDHPGPSAASLEPPSPEYGITISTSSSHSSLSLPVLTPLTPSSLSAIPEQPLGKGEISRAERLKAKEERRATRALRRISSSSMSSAASGALIAPPPLPNDLTFDPQHSMDNVLEKLRPFGNT